MFGFSTFRAFGVFGASKSRKNQLKTAKVGRKNEIWNKLRQKDLEKDVRNGYVTKIMELIKGKIWEIVSRLRRRALVHGSVE